MSKPKLPPMVKAAKEQWLNILELACLGTHWKPGELAGVLEGMLGEPKALIGADLTAMANDAITWLNSRNALLVIKNDHYAKVAKKNQRKQAKEALKQLHMQQEAMKAELDLEVLPVNEATNNGDPYNQ